MREAASCNVSAGHPIELRGPYASQWNAMTLVSRNAVTRWRVHLLLPAAGLALGCTSSESVPERDSVSAPAGTDAAVATAPWYAGSRTLDLTGDGVADSVRLDARGERPDSLRITLRLLVEGREAHREEWGSSYELALVDSAIVRSSRVDSVLRVKLDSVLASVKLHALDAPGARPMLEDSATLAALHPRPTHQVSFSYGYESTARLAWDAPRRRFVQLWSCC
jgi:hypothetical protein